jgi:tryptophan synthase beta chain
MTRVHDTPSTDRFGAFGGRYVPETLIPALDELDAAWNAAAKDKAFLAEVDDMLTNYVGRPSPLSTAPRFSALVGTTVWLKREDLNHTGAHKINNTVGRSASSPRPGRGSTASRPRRSARDMGSSASCTWVRRTRTGRS